MTKRRPNNRLPTGANKSLGNSLRNAHHKASRAHRIGKNDEDDIDNPAFVEKESIHYIESITDETSLEEFLAKAELADRQFTAERDSFRILDNTPTIVVPSVLDIAENVKLQDEYKDRLKIPRRPPKDAWEDLEDLKKLENENFLQWRNDLAALQQVNGLVLTPFERNLDMWRELWRVVEKSDIVIQIVDARNPLLFYSMDLDDYVKEVDPAKQTVLLLNKSDLLEEEHLKMWMDYFKEKKIQAIFWSAIENPKPTRVDEEEEEEASMSEDSESESTSTATMEQDSEVLTAETTSSDLLIRDSAALIERLKRIGMIKGVPGEKQLTVGFVGYPNVGKSSTINKLVGTKKVAVSATPGKTRHFQTIHLDEELCLCDCPGLVMPAFAFGRDEMLLNGILPVDHMRDHFGPVGLLMTRMPLNILEDAYAMMLPKEGKPSPLSLLTCLAFVRGFMSSAGIPDCSRAARLIIKDLISGKLLWVAAPPATTSQEDFDRITYRETDTERKQKGQVALEQIEKRGLLNGDEQRSKQLDANFFGEGVGTAHVKGVSRGVTKKKDGAKKHNNRNKKEKLRRIYADQ
ncbi:hypothetical protein WR25_10008 [Diploscapter pachys]|uniref:Large subunit GTPase 1 homolog n=1 Tax=Diploscapter pachys TaxID=2018661 RepID=A0A2A2L6X7_9BILA|nr:hypothetical protein WR25_10008 [Diploscapter pachys]